MKRTSAIATSLVVATVFLWHCRTNPIVNFSVVVPGGQDVAWLEMAAYPGARCDALVRLSEAGLPSEGDALRAIWKPGTTPPSLGDLPKRDYAFIATAKTANCEVVAVGCTNADLTDARDISVTLGSAPNRRGGCGERETCSHARCVPQPSGAGCTLNTVGEGPLASVATLAAQPLASPAIAAFGDSFIVASAEFASDGAPTDAGVGEARTYVTTQVVDGAGGSRFGSQLPLGSRCANIPQTDGLGLTFLADEASEGNAFVLVSRNQCDGNAGVDVLNVATNASLATGKTSRLGIAPGSVVLAKSHSMVGRISKKFIGAYSRDNATIVLPMTKAADDNAQADPAVLLAPPTTVPPVLAATSKTLAVFTRGAATAGDAGTIAGLTVSTTTLSGTASIPSFGNSRGIPGNWVTAIAGNEQIYALVGSPGKLSIWTIGAKASDDKILFELAIEADVPFADIAYIASDGDTPVARLVVAYQNAGGFVFRVIDINGDPVEAQTVRYHPSRLLPTKGARDHQFSLAATKSRIGLAWATATQLSEGEPVGGYAVFSCEK